MSAVAFAIGSGPGLSQHEAEDLARLLELGRNVAALELAGRIRQQARLDPDQRPASTDIELDRVDLDQIAQVFVDGPDLLGVPAFDHLNREVLAALGRA
jgi:hypothetical protein